MEECKIEFSDEEYALLIETANAKGMSVEKFILDCVKWIRTPETCGEAAVFLQETVKQDEETCQSTLLDQRYHTRGNENE